MWLFLLTNKTSFPVFDDLFAILVEQYYHLSIYSAIMLPWN